MKIIKYTKSGNNNYTILLDNNNKIKLNEDLILKNNLLYKKEIDAYELSELTKENKKYDIYNKCIKYISIRLRSINEMKEYLKKNDIDEIASDKIINKLIDNKLLNDELFTKAFINDKLKFSTMGPYRIEQELKKHKIDNLIINKYINEIDNNYLVEKINKQINKIIKSTKKNNNIRNKIYNNLLSLGYSNELIVNNLNKYNF